MSASPSNPAWFRYLTFWRRDPRAELDQEIAFHLEARVDEYLASGLDPDAARALARELPQRVPKVAHHTRHRLGHGSPPRIARFNALAVFAHTREVAQAFDGERAGGIGVETARHVLLDACLEVERDLLVELGARIPAPEREVAKPGRVRWIRRHAGCPRYVQAGRLVLVSTLATADANADHDDASSLSCWRPRAVIR